MRYKAIVQIDLAICKIIFPFFCFNFYNFHITFDLFPFDLCCNLLYLKKTSIYIKYILLNNQNHHSFFICDIFFCFQKLLFHCLPNHKQINFFYFSTKRKVHNIVLGLKTWNFKHIKIYWAWKSETINESEFIVLLVVW